jgi:hypothetical protein
MHRYQYQLWKSMQYRYRYFPIQYNIVWALTIRTVSVLLYNYRINSTVIFLISNKSILNIRTSSKLKNRQFTVTVINYIKRSKSIATKYRNTLTKNVSAILYWYSTEKSIAIAISILENVSAILSIPILYRDINNPGVYDRNTTTHTFYNYLVLLHGLNNIC